MESRLLKTLADQARSGTDRDSWARAVCRSASHYARQGHTDQAMAAIASVRAQYGNDLSASAGTWLMLAEGIMHFFDDRWVEGFDRARRAYAIAFAANLVEAKPTCAAWMAHMHFNALRFEAMAIHLEEALTLARNDDHQARARASLVLADALHYAGDFQLARPWYERTRIHAAAEGDEATLSALLHNVAAFRAGNVRMADTFSVASPIEAKHALMQANSAWNFDTAIGTASFQMLVPLLQGQLLAVQRDFLAAERMLKTVDASALEKKSIPLLWVDMAWCLAAQGRSADARKFATDAESLIDAKTDIDEVAYINSRLAQIAERRGDTVEAAARRAIASTALATHRQVQANLNRRLLALSELRI